MTYRLAFDYFLTLLGSWMADRHGHWV